MNYQYCNGETYTIQKGDSLYTISKKYNVPLALILWANPCADIYNLQIGDKVCIPRRVSPIPVYPITQPKEDTAPVVEPPQERPMEETMPSNRTPMNGTPINGMPMNGMPMNGMPMNGMPMNGMPMNGMPMNQMPSNTETPENMAPNGNISSNQMPVREHLDVSVIEYVVQENDSVQSILDYFEIEFKDLMEFNNANDMLLKPGITIRIPQENEG